MMLTFCRSRGSLREVLGNEKSIMPEFHVRDYSKSLTRSTDGENVGITWTIAKPFFVLDVIYTSIIPNSLLSSSVDSESASPQTPIAYTYMRNTLS